MDFTAIINLVNQLFNQRTLGSATISANAAALSASVSTNPSPSDTFLNSAIVVVSVADFYNITVASNGATSLINTAQLLSNVQQAIVERDENSGIISPQTELAIANNISGILTGISGGLLITRPNVPLTIAHAILTATNVALTYLSINAPNIEAYVAQLAADQQLVIDIYDGVVNDRQAAIANQYHNFLSNEAAIIGITEAELLQSITRTPFQNLNRPPIII